MTAGDASDPKYSATQPEFRAWRPTSQAAALGLAVEYLSTKPAFANLRFGPWSQALFFEIVRKHFVFVVDRRQRICGFLGWALTERRLADLWLEGRSGLSNDQCLEGECVIIDAWSADTEAVQRFLLAAASRLFTGRKALYFKRRYADGRERAVRLPAAAHRTARK